MSRNIFIISCIKNEEDIIESFIRYHMEIADGMVILDNCSSDRTLEILEKLKNEGLALHIIQDTSREFRQAEKTTQLMNYTIENFSPDIIIPLDSDEFIVSKKGFGNPREAIEKLEDDKIYFIGLYNCIFSDISSNDIFMPKRSLKLSATSTSNKVAFTSNFIKSRNFSLSEGNHDISIPIDKEHYPLHIILDQYNLYRSGQKCSTTFSRDNGAILDVVDFYNKNKEKFDFRKGDVDIFLVHLPNRSIEQLKSKFLVGWISLKSRLDKISAQGAYYETAFNKIKNSEPIDDSFALSKNFFDFSIDLSYHKESFYKLKYTSSEPVNYLSNTLNTTLQLTEDYIQTRKRNIELIEKLQNIENKYVLLTIQQLYNSESTKAAVTILREYSPEKIISCIKEPLKQKTTLDLITKKMISILGEGPTISWLQSTNDNINTI